MINIERINDYAQKHEAHKEQLGVLRECQRQIYRVLKTIDLKAAGEYKFISKVACYVMAENIDEINHGMLKCLEINCFSAVESLARVSIESSINLMYVTKDKDSLKPRSLIKSYLASSAKRAANWLNYAKTIDDAKYLERAKLFSAHVESVSGIFKDINNSDAFPHWPDARSRFRSVGLEAFYHILFAPTSDSIHGFSEDIFNSLLIDLSPNELDVKYALLRAQKAEKLSMAYYLTTNAVLFFCDAAHRVCCRSQCEAEAAELDGVVIKLNGIVAVHENLMDIYYEEHS
ncbi:hypothetical protein HX794_13450 [Pseudomonas costantinii]|uniref:DUF5677 domain-containing protein n=1 Tax=Pseudomonas costantinii TaxID=168469 RepID=UPI0015A0B36B|nr:DUF5677 domain-containing protein [Pseudomonas costantinii]NVZ20640.1 hypothetical protein [Pseudomonas costantinii]